MTLAKLIDLSVEFLSHSTSGLLMIGLFMRWARRTDGRITVLEKANNIVPMPTPPPTIVNVIGEAIAEVIFARK